VAVLPKNVWALSLFAWGSWEHPHVWMNFATPRPLSLLETSLMEEIRGGDLLLPTWNFPFSSTVHTCEEKAKICVGFGIGSFPFD